MNTHTIRIKDFAPPEALSDPATPGNNTQRAKYPTPSREVAMPPLERAKNRMLSHIESQRKRFADSPDHLIRLDRMQADLIESFDAEVAAADPSKEEETK